MICIATPTEEEPPIEWPEADGVDLHRPPRLSAATVIFEMADDRPLCKCCWPPMRH